MPLPCSDDSVHVYIIGYDDGPKKIGMSKDPASRQKVLGVDGWREMPCVYHRQGFSRETARRIERHTHMMLAEKRIEGEWFDVTADEARTAISAAVASVQAGEQLPVVKPKRLIIDLDPKLHNRLKIKAYEEGTTIADIARKLLSDWADREDRKLMAAAG